MSQMDREGIRVVAVDLQYLRDEWDDSITVDGLRRNSTVLRRLLVHNDYSNAWRAVGLAREPRVTSLDMSSYLQGIAPERIIFAQVGGGRRNGAQVMAATVVDYAMTAAEVKARYELSQAQIADMQPSGLHGYMKRPCMMIRATTAGVAPIPVTRQQLVHFVADTRGGAHYDAKSSPQNAAEFAYLALGSVFANASRTADLPGIYFALFSIAQAVAHSEDAKTFDERARALLGQP